MKKLLTIITITIVISACTQKLCPTYSKIDTTEKLV
jgi:hypothetical protein